MTTLTEFLTESLDEEVFAIVDETDAIQAIFNSKEEADENIKEFPEIAKVKVKKIKKSEVEEN